jgi:hypothetical protein
MAGTRKLLRLGLKREPFGAAIQDILGRHQWETEHLLAIVVVLSALVAKHW